MINGASIYNLSDLLLLNRVFAGVNSDVYTFFGSVVFLYSELR